MKKAFQLLCVAGIVAACSPASSPRPASTLGSSATTAIVAYVYRSPTCTCCHSWEAYLRSHGYTVQSVETNDLASLKAQMNVPSTAWSCHTAVIDGYVVEGHVPVEAIEKLLAQRLQIDGIALAGMPAGSPGMPGVKAEPLQVLSLVAGATEAFGSY